MPRGRLQSSTDAVSLEHPSSQRHFFHLERVFCMPPFLACPPRCVYRDAAYRGPMYQGLSEGNATKYLTLEKDLGGFNNIRISLEAAVALAAAMGRTFVIPPPFSIWRMNTKVGKKVRSFGRSPRRYRGTCCN